MLNSGNQEPVSGEPNAHEKTEQVERLLRSRALQNSESLKALLNYIAAKVIEAQDSQIKEYTIAVEVFGRGKDFNASIDSLVRVQAKRLRDKVKEYYETEGKADKVIIAIPKGHYSPVFTYRQEEPLSVPGEHSEDPVQSPPFEAQLTQPAPVVRPLFNVRSGHYMLLAAASLLAIASVSLAVWNRALRRQADAEHMVQSAGAVYGSAWDPFTKSTSPTLVILSNPPLFRFANAADPDGVVKNAIEMKPEQYARAAETLKDRFVAKQPGKLKLVFAPREYTGVGEAVGLYRVAELLKSAGTTVRFKQSRTVSAEDLKANNVVILGSVWANVWSGKIPIKEDFEHTLAATIRNNNPAAGERTEYSPRFNGATGDLVEDYALVTVRPGLTDENTVMVLAGIESEGTQGAAEFVTSPEYLNVLNQRLKEASGNGSPPKYYQALLKVDVDNGIPTTVTILAVHSLKADRN